MECVRLPLNVHQNSGSLTYVYIKFLCIREWQCDDPTGVNDYN